MHSMKMFLKRIMNLDRNNVILYMQRKSALAYKRRNFTKAIRIMNKCSSKYGCDLSPGALIGIGLNLPHPVGVVIGEGVTIGDNVTIYQSSTLGRKEKNMEGYPTIEDDVVIYSNSVILGDVKIGKGAVVGCGAIVLRDVEPGEVVYGVVK